MENAEKFHLKDVYYTERGDKKVFKISWKMTDFCPYHCSYCYMANAVAAAKAKKDNPTQEQVEEIASKLDKYIDSHAEKDAKIWLHLIGGEVSMFNLINILAKIKRLNAISIATNLYRNVDYWKDLKEYCKSRKISFGISGSFHLEMLNEKQRWDFCEKLNAIHSQMKAVVSNSNCEEYKPYFKYMMDHNLALEITICRDNENRGEHLTEENQKYIDSLRKYQYELRAKKGLKPYYIAHLKNGSTFEYTSNIALLNNTYEGILDYTGFYCNAGENNIRINQKGDLLRSACRICSSIMKLGNIFDESTWVPKKDIKPFICDCNYKGKNEVRQLKGCTCFNNTEMWLPGYNRKTKEYIEQKNVKVPNYFAMYEGVNQLKDCDWSRANEIDEDDLKNKINEETNGE